MILRTCVLCTRSFESRTSLLDLRTFYAVLLVIATGVSYVRTVWQGSRRNVNIHFNYSDFQDFKQSADWEELRIQIKPLVNVTDYVDMVDTLCAHVLAAPAPLVLNSRNPVRLPFCNYLLPIALANNDCFAMNASSCRSCLFKRVLQHDMSAAVEFHRFQTVLDNYDCGHGAQDERDDEYDEQDIWSNQLFTCAECADLYKDWLCGVKLRIYIHSSWIPPCVSFCKRVTEACPFFVPEVDDGSGESLFFCSPDDAHYDRNYFRKEQCYTECELRRFIRNQSLDSSTGKCSGSKIFGW